MFCNRLHKEYTMTEIMCQYDLLIYETIFLYVDFKILYQNLSKINQTLLSMISWIDVIND